MATLKTTVELNDKVTSRLTAITAAAEVTDRALGRLDDRFKGLGVTAEASSTKWRNSMATMKSSTRLAVSEIVAEINVLKAELVKLTKAKHTVNIDADTGAAHAQIQALRADIASLNNSPSVRVGRFGGLFGRKQGVSVSSSSSVSSAELFSNVINSTGKMPDPDKLIAAQTRLATQESKERAAGTRAASAAAGRRASKRGFSDRVFGKQGSVGIPGMGMSMPLPVAGVAATQLPAMMGVASGAVGGFSTIIASLSAGLVSATSMLGAFTMGIGLTAIPVAGAAKRVGEWRKKIDEAEASVAKATPGTKRHTNALKKYNDLLAKMPKNIKEISSNIDSLESTWEKFVTNGESGSRAIDLINSSLKFAEKVVPFVANEMNQFTDVSAKLFRDLDKNSPQLISLATRVFAPWPKYFDQSTRALGHFAAGFGGLMIAAEPMTNWLSESFLAKMKSFDDFASSAAGSEKLQKFFTDMMPVLDEVGDTFGSFFEAMFAIGGDPKMQAMTIDFLRGVQGFFEAAPPHVVTMTEKVSALSPIFEVFGKTLLIFSEDMLSFWGGFADTIGRVADGAEGLPVFGKLAGWLNDTDNSAQVLAKTLEGVIGIAAGLKVLKGIKFTMQLLGITKKAPMPVIVMNPGMMGAGAMGKGGALATMLRAAMPIALPLIGGALAGAAISAGAWKLSEWLEERREKKRKMYNDMYDDDITTGAIGGQQTAQERGARPVPKDWVPETRPKSSAQETVDRWLTPPSGSDGWTPGDDLRYRMLQNYTDGVNNVDRFMRGTGANTLIAAIEAAISQSGNAGVVAIQTQMGKVFYEYNKALSTISQMQTNIQRAYPLAIDPERSFDRNIFEMFDTQERQQPGFGRAQPPFRSPMSSVGDAPSDVLAGDSDPLMSQVNSSFASAQNNLNQMTGPLAQYGRVGERAKTNLNNVYSNARTALTSFLQQQQAAAAGSSWEMGSDGSTATVGGISASLNSVAAAAAGLGLTMTSGKRNGKNGSWHNTNEAMDFSNVAGAGIGGSPQMDALYNSLVPLAASGAIGQLIYKNNGWFGGKLTHYAPMDHHNHVHVGIRGSRGGAAKGSGPKGDAPAEMLLPSGSISSNNTSAGHASVTQAILKEFTIVNQSDIDDVAAELASRLQDHLTNRPIYSGADLED